jgi:aspartate/glutamate racemase
MHIGLIGGIGPAATIVYYDRLTRLVREAAGGWSHDRPNDVCG